MLKCNDGSLYTGIAKDLLKRVDVHNSGKGAKYTRARLPVEIVYSCAPYTKSAALKLERKIKKLSRNQKIKLIA
jgi:predicted GIY-YIG superfamily endonuclease